MILQFEKRLLTCTIPCPIEMLNIERNAFLVSGGGSTMLEMVKASMGGETPGFQPAVVIASNPYAGAIEKAQSVGLSVEIVDPNTFRGDDGKVDQYSYYQGLRKATDKYGATVFTQNGHLPLTPVDYILYMSRFGQGGFNQHPGRVPDFGGKGMFGRRVHAATLIFKRDVRSDKMMTTPIVQRVHLEFDKGAVVGFRDVLIAPNDTVDELQQRVLPVEHEINVQLAKDIGSGRIQEYEFVSEIKPGEEINLRNAKRITRLLYPNG